MMLKTRPLIVLAVSIFKRMFQYEINDIAMKWIAEYNRLASVQLWRSPQMQLIKLLNKNYVLLFTFKNKPNKTS